MKEIKFRAWDKREKEIYIWEDSHDRNLILDALPSKRSQDEK